MSETPSSVVRDISTAALQSFPPVTVAALTLNQWVAIATIAYIALQAAYLARKWFREERAKRAAGA